MSASDVQLRETHRDDAEHEGGDGAPGEITSILQNITALIAAADRRQEEALRELHARLEGLGHEARSVRGRVPDEYVPDFERIEEGLTQIAGRISRAEIERMALRYDAEQTRAAQQMRGLADHDGDDTTASVTADPLHDAAPHPSQSQAESAAPAPLRSAIAVPEALRGTLSAEVRRTSPADIDPFDLVDSTRPGDPAHPWDIEAAEALTRVYESLAGKARLEPQAEAQRAVYDLDEPVAPIPPEAKYHQAESLSAPVVAPQQVAAEPAPATPVLDFGRDWLEARFADIASRVEQSMLELRSQPAPIDLYGRFDQLESRFGAVLEGVASRSDTDGLRQFETHLDELAHHVESAQLQLQRLDTIEAQLNAVMDKLSDQRLSQILEQSSPAGVDAERIAHAAAEQVAQRLSSLVPATGSSEDGKRLDDLRAMLDTFMSERRQGEEQTASMLDTMQHAMIRLLDRVDAIEFSPNAAGQDPESDYAPPATASALGVQPALGMGAHGSANLRPQPEDKGSRIEPSLQPSEAKPFQLSTEGEDNTQAKPDDGRPQMRVTDVTRDQLIADARRAMQAAAAKREAEAELAAAQENAPPRDGGASTGGISKSTRRIMVGACTLMLLSSAVLLLMPRKQAPAPVTDPKASTQLAPAEKTVTAPTAPVAAPTPAPPVTVAPSAPIVKVPDKAAEAPKPSRQSIPKEFLPKSVPETAIDELSSPVDLGSGRGMVQESKASGAVFPGITLHGGGMSPLDVARAKEQQRVADISTRLGQAQSAAIQETGSIPIGYAPDGMPQHGQAARLADTPPSAARSVAAAANEMPPLMIGPSSLRQAAAKGDPSAEFEVAARFAEGKGISQDFNQAVRWYQRAASQSHAPAQYRLGTLFERGLGVKADAARARVWYQQAADQGHVKAMHNLAVLSASRESGSPDYATAGRWFKEAAERGLADSQYNLAVLCESGLGMQKDLPQAYKWFSIAARSGDREARRRLDILRPKLSASEIAAGEGLVSAYVPKLADRLVNDAHAAGEAWKGRANGDTPAG